MMAHHQESMMTDKAQVRENNYGLRKDTNMFGKRDPICQSPVCKKTEHKYEYKGKVYYFDSAACLGTFNEPGKFIKKKSERLLTMMAKNNKDVPKSCHYLKRRVVL